MTRKVFVEVWICDRCLNYYGASSAGDLDSKVNKDEKNQPTFPRSQCPNCGTRRTKHTIKVKLKEQSHA